MKTGKLSESVLKRSIFKRIKNKRPEVIVAGGVGRDFGAIEPAPEEVMVISTNAYPDVAEDKAYYAIMGAVNNIAVSGAEPVAVSLGGFLPEDFEEADLKKLIDEADEVCKALEIQAICGHTQITAAVNEPVISVTAAGTVKRTDLIKPGGAGPGQDIVVTKWIGLAGTSILANKYADRIAEKYKEDLINSARDMKKLMSIVPEAAVARKSGAGAMHDLSQGGIYNGLWEMAESSGVGLTIDIKKIPLRQETVEICEIFDINPYRLLSGGSLLIAADDGQALADKLMEEGIYATVIGRFTDSNDRIIMNEDEVTYLDSPRQEELLRVM